MNTFSKNELTLESCIKMYKIAFDKADEFHLTSLTRYPGNNLSIEIKEGGVLAMGALTDNQSDGTAVGSGYTLSITDCFYINFIVLPINIKISPTIFFVH